MNQFITELLQNDLASYIQLVNLMESLQGLGVDLKQLAALRILFPDNISRMPYERFRQDLTLFMQGNRQPEQVVQKIMSFVRVG
jgi:hypothetical protein